MLTLYIADAERDAGMKNLSRKEALEILNGMKVKIKIPKAAVMQNKRNAALDMAIEALKYSEIPNSSTDCISRQAAIDALGERPMVWVESDYELGARNQYDADVLALETVPSAQPEQQWIPCGERLPERGEDVLVTRDYDGRKDNNKSCRYVEVASCYGEDDDITWSSFSDEYKMHPKNHYVVAWMPLPKPWKGDTRE